jgi:hypothetical protein
MESESPEPSAGGEALEWTVHPARERPWQCMAVVAVIVLACVGVWYGFQSLWFAFIAAVVLPLSLLSYFAPTTYRLSKEGVEVRGPLFTDRREWSKFRRVFPDRDGVLLTPLKRPTRLAYTRGVYLRCADNREAVAGLARDMLARAEDIG